MKKLIMVSFLALAMLVALTGCELYNAINVAWNINTFSYDGLSGLTSVTYTVQNQGKIDLTGVNLKIGVDIGGFYVSKWTPDFSLKQDQILHGSLDIYTGTAPLDVTVLSVDMDNPPN